MLNAANDLSAEDATSKIMGPTASEEASENLLTVVDLAKEKVSGDLKGVDEIVSEIVKKTKFDRVRDAAEGLVATN